ncbi:MAG TPA: serine/threonine-protein kinase, partial [Streptosporangiaceae bacterium]
MLRGRYRLDVLIATGGMGEVWRGTDLAIDRRVAIKVVRPERAGDEEGLARFRAEAHHAGSLSHPNIAQVFDYGEAVDPEPGYLVMELVEGLSLTRILDDGPLPPEDVMDIVAQTARGLAAAHRAGLVHRDVKPGNLLVRSDGLVKITDFGIARAVGDTTVTQPGMLIGTPAYLAPERVSGAPASPPTDLYSLGVVAYQCLTGHPPFAGEPLVVALAHLDQGMPALPASVPPGVAALVAELTRQDPAARPPSAWDVALRAGHLRVLLSSPESLGRRGTAAAPPSVPGAEGALLAGAALPGTGPAAGA